MQDIADNFVSLCRTSENILILCSRPIDADTMGTALALELYISNHLKKIATVGTSFEIEEAYFEFPEVNRILHIADPTEFLLDYDLIITVDGSSWDRFFLSRYLPEVVKANKEKFFNLDHHLPDDICKTIPERALREPLSSTAEVLYKYLLKKKKNIISPKMADLLYLAVLGDTNRFRWNVTSQTLQFASSLIEAGANHDKSVAESIDQKNIKFMAWAIENADYIEENKVIYLRIDKNSATYLKKELGGQWYNYVHHYKDQVLTSVKGYNMGIILMDDPETERLRVFWRIRRDIEENIDMVKILTDLGFEAGGHHHMGGGTLTKYNRKVTSNFLNELGSYVHW